MDNAIHWFELPADDFERAIGFYETVLSCRLERETMGGDMLMGMFPHSRPGVGGAVLKHPMARPGASGAIVYLSGGDDLSAPLARIERAGGKVLVPKTLITEEIGYYAVFVDSEGNHVGLHSLH